MAFIIQVNAQTLLRGKVLEIETKNPIVNAKISISGQGIGVVTNENGYFNYNKYYEVIDRNSTLEIKAKGYQSISLTGASIRDILGVLSTTLLKKSDDNYPRNLQNVKIYWDTSIKNYDQNDVLENILSFLEKEKTETIKLIFFDEKILGEKTLLVNTDLRETFKNEISNYNVPSKSSNYKLIDDENTDGVVIVTEGKPSYGEPNLDGMVPFFPLVTDIKDIDVVFLKNLVDFSDGYFLNKDLSFLEDVNKTYLSGTVTSPIGLLRGAVISKKGSFQEYYSSINGDFKIPAKDGDIISISYLGMHKQSILINDDIIKTKMEIELIPLAEILDEIILNGKKAKDNDRTISTGFGEKSEDEIGTSIDQLEESDISSDIVFLGDLLRGKFPGVNVSGFGTDATISIRNTRNQSFGSTNIGEPPLWVVDGALFQGVSLQEMNGIVNPQNIKSISVLKSLKAAVAYGIAGVNGVIIIKTKTASRDYKKEEPPKSLIVTGNDYNENIPIINTTSQEDYIIEVDKMESIFDRYEKFKELEKENSNSIPFYIDMAIYFSSDNKNIEYSNEILQKLTNIANNNIKVLRIISYVYESNGQYEKARRVYERILKLAPKEAQSYRDLAMIYQEVGEYNKSLELYINIISNKIVGVNFSGIRQNILNEFKRLVLKHKSNIEFERLPNEFLTVGEDIDLRIVISWSDYSAPFEFQFVNPEKKFFSWTHTLDQNKERLFEEQLQGYQMEEFFVDDETSGEWLVNIQYFKDSFNEEIPPYLKYVVYQNYGSKDETKKIKLVKLYENDKKISLDKINVN